MSKRHPPPAELVKFLKPYDRAIQKLALSVRSLVLEEMAPCYENIYDAYSAVAIGYGTSDRLKDGIFHVAVYTNHVNLGFNHGASLDDPLGILEGNGNQIRHLKIQTLTDLARPEIRDYVRRAKQVALDDAIKLGEIDPKTQKQRTAKKTGGVISTVKAIYPRKRRPAPKI